MPSPKAHRSVAAQQGRAAAQRQLAGGGMVSSECNGDPLERYLQDLAEWVERTKYAFGPDVKAKDRKCLWCGKKQKLSVGRLSFVGGLYFCPDCEDSYRTCKERKVRSEIVETEPELKVHLADAWGVSSCGVGSRVSEHMNRVTCKRCLAYYGTSSVPNFVLRFLGGEK